MAEPEFPTDGILWRGYDATIEEMDKRPRPVLSFVLDESPMCWPFLREIFAAMPKSERLRNALNGPCVGMFLRPDQVPEGLRMQGLGDRFYIAILPPDCLNPMATFSCVTGDPAALVEQIARALEAIAPAYAARTSDPHA